MFLIVAILLFVTAIVGPSYAYTPAFLGKIEFARTRALGGAGSALPDDIGAIWINPASTAMMSRSTVAFSGMRGFFGDVIGSGLWVLPTKLGSISVGALYSDAGMVSLIASDDTVREVKASTETMTLLGYSREFSPEFAAGANFRIISSELAEEFTETTAMWDFGVQIRHSRYFSIGAVLRNIGFGLKYDADTVPLPAVFRAGFMLGANMSDILPFAATRDDSVLFVGDAEFNFREELVIWRGGIEYSWRKMLAARIGGHKSAVEMLGNISAGFGVALGGGGDDTRRYRMDYSVRLQSQGFDMPQSVTITIPF